ncbi:PspA/IM30 family protein [Paenibacillus chartarius]|uniref:PspA/IM30 family protein n=1 Tax=Paenibacillus chartarius TaxID=747481 RepID=A0ABV6DG06_9BACL
MGIFSRVKSIALADIHDALDRMEDPVNMVKQYIREVQEQIDKVRTTLAGHLFTETQCEALVNRTEELVAKRTRQAELAVDRGEDAIAELAIQEKLVQVQKLEMYREQYEAVKAQTAALLEQLRELQATREALVQKHEALAARAEAARTIRDVNRVIHSFDAQKMNGALAGMEQQVWRWEAEAKASRAVNQLMGGSAVQERERKLRADVMEELAMLKEQRKQA